MNTVNILNTRKQYSRGKVSSRYSRNFEANASKFLEFNHEDA